MPATSAFLRGFSLTKGLMLANYRLTDIQADHNQIERFKRYQFPMKLTFQATSTPVNIDALGSQLYALLSQHQIINSQYGNPYDCYFIALSYEQISPNQQTVTIAALGEAVRV